MMLNDNLKPGSGRMATATPVSGDAFRFGFGAFMILLLDLFVSLLVSVTRASALFGHSSTGKIRICSILVIAFVSLLAGGLRPADATVSAQEFAVATADENELAPDINGDVAVWVVGRSGGSDIQGKSLSTGADLNLPADPGDQIRPSVSGRTVVWEDTSSGNSDIYGFDLSTGQKFPIAVGSSSNQSRPAISGRTVVWQDDRNGNWDIYSFNLDTKQESPVTTADGDQRTPVVGGDTVVWEDRSATDADIVAKSLTTGSEVRVADEPAGQDPAWQDMPSISGDVIVWRDGRNPGSQDIFAYDLAAKREREVAVGPGDQYSPDISGRVVVWTDGGGADPDIYGQDLSTGERFRVSSTSGSREAPSVSGDRVVWEIQRAGEVGFGTFDVRGARLDLAPIAPSGLTATGLGSGIKLDWASNTEGDLAGYNVYRSDRADAGYVKLNENGLVTASAYEDGNAPKGVKSYYRVTAVDEAGSESAAVDANAVAPWSTDINLSSNVSTVEYNVGTITLSGQLNYSAAGPLPGKMVVLEQRPAGDQAWSSVKGGQLTTDSEGRFSLAGVKPTTNTEYRAHFSGEAGTILPSVSASTQVGVKALISASPSVSTLKFGQKLTVSGLVWPVAKGYVTTTIKRNGLVVLKQDAPLNNHYYSTAYKPTAPGTYVVSVSFAGNGTFAGNTSATRYFRVVR